MRYYTEYTIERDCPLCSSTNIQDLYPIGYKFRIAKCLNCELMFTIPRPTIEELNEFYNTAFQYNYEPTPLSKKRACFLTKGFHKLIKSYNPDAKNVLEIGCSYGHTLYGLKQWGYEVTGTDLSNSSCNYASKNYGLIVYNSEFPPSKLLGEFDVIILSQIIEHVLEPLDFMVLTSNYLRKGGIVYIGTPNINCILFDIFGRHFEPIKPPEHINFFNPHSIEKIFSKSGLKCLKVYTESPIWVEYNLFNYVFTSTLRLSHLLQTVRKKQKISIDNLLACSTGFTTKSTILFGLRLIMDYFTRLFSLTAYSILKILDKNGKGLVLCAIARKN